MRSTFFIVVFVKHNFAIPLYSWSTVPDHGKVRIYS